jgi:DNA polymerase III subunit beta
VSLVLESEETNEGGQQDDLRFHLRKSVLQDALEKVTPALSHRDTGLPALRDFKIEVLPEALSIGATDLELTILTRTEDVQVSRPGSLVLPSKKALELLRSAPDGELEVSVGAGVAYLQLAETRWTLRLPVAEYPAFPDVSGTPAIVVDRARFLSAIDSVKYAVATDLIRPSLRLIDINYGKMRAADGVRCQQVDISDFWDSSVSLQIPLRAISDLCQVLQGGPDEQCPGGMGGL